MIFGKSKAITDLQTKLHTAHSRLSFAYYENKKLRKRIEELENANHSETMDNDTMNDVKWWETNWYFSYKDGRIYEIINVKTGKVLKHEGFTKMEDAYDYAKELVKSDPSLHLAINAPIGYVKADIPIVTETVTHEPAETPVEVLTE